LGQIAVRIINVFVRLLHAVLHEADMVSKVVDIFCIVRTPGSRKPLLGTAVETVVLVAIGKGA
uniref:hypothetical protein n=1 Tax=Bacteroides rodentium TaxID=691816 RepID=UPI001AE0A8AF